MKKISLVTSLYRSAPYVLEYYQRHIESLKKLDLDYEFIFVNDGSPDHSAEVVKSLIAKDNKVQLVDLSRNFGQHPAMFAGLAHATGDLVYATDCDLEEDPENIVPMYELFKKSADADVVYGVLNKRSGGFLRNIIGGLFYVVLDFLSDIKVPRDQAWQRIMSQRYVKALLKYQEVETLPAGLMVLAGFQQIPYAMDKGYKGSSTYSFGRRLKLALNAITAFSSRPLTLICLLGLFLTLISFMAILITIVCKLLGLEFQSGWASIIASIWCVGGMILASVGVVGIYLAKIFNQVKRRPLYIVKQVHKL